MERVLAGRNTKMKDTGKVPQSHGQMWEGIWEKARVKELRLACTGPQEQNTELTLYKGVKRASECLDHEIGTRRVSLSPSTKQNVFESSGKGTQGPVYASQVQGTSLVPSSTFCVG